MAIVALFWLIFSIAFAFSLITQSPEAPIAKTTNDWINSVIGEAVMVAIWVMYIRRQFFSVRIDEVGIVYFSLLRKVSIRYSEMQGGRLRVVAPFTPSVLFLLTIWHSRRALNIFALAFSRRQIAEMRELIQARFEQAFPDQVTSNVNAFWLEDSQKEKVSKGRR